MKETEVAKHPLHFGENHEEIFIEYSNQNTYKGSLVTEDGRSSSAIKFRTLTWETKRKKFIIFFDRNQGPLFQYTKAVLHA